MTHDETNQTSGSESATSSGLEENQPKVVRIRKDVLVAVVAAVIILFAILANGSGDDNSPAGDSNAATFVTVKTPMDEIVSQIDNRQYEEAIVKLKAILVNDPKNAVAYYNLGVAYQFTDRLVEAEKNYTLGLELDNQNASAYYNRGLARRDLGRLKEAAADLKIAVALKGDWAAAKFNLGQVLISLGDSIEGNKQIDAAREISPDIGK
jgi:tetratricopeptide (TPR) repeat protein